jgi:hypothetical protein
MFVRVIRPMKSRHFPRQPARKPGPPEIRHIRATLASAALPGPDLVAFPNFSGRPGVTGAVHNNAMTTI